MLRVDLARLGREGRLRIEGTIGPEELESPDAGFRPTGAFNASLTADSMVFGPPDELSEDDDEIRTIEAGAMEIDLLPHLREELLLTVPPYAECKDECRGLCPGCGVNLNEEDCGCGEKESDPRWDALRALKNE
jgi:uncharacterized metal-binding protein YceD (DUF177 family)